MWFVGPVTEGSDSLGKAVRFAENHPMDIIHGMHRSLPVKQFPVGFLKPLLMEEYLPQTTWLELELPTSAMMDTDCHPRNSPQPPASPMEHGVIIIRPLAVLLLHVRVLILLPWNMEDGEL